MVVVPVDPVKVARSIIETHSVFLGRHEIVVDREILPILKLSMMGRNVARETVKGVLKISGQKVHLFVGDFHEVQARDLMPFPPIRLVRVLHHVSLFHGLFALSDLHGLGLVVAIHARFPDVLGWLVLACNQSVHRDGNAKEHHDQLQNPGPLLPQCRFSH